MPGTIPGIRYVPVYAYLGRSGIATSTSDIIGGHGCFFVNELVELRRAGGGRLCHVVGLPSSDGETQLLKAVVNGMTAVVLRYYRVPDQQYHFWGELWIACCSQ